MPFAVTKTLLVVICVSTWPSMPNAELQIMQPVKRRLSALVLVLSVQRVNIWQMEQTASKRANVGLESVFHSARRKVFHFNNSNFKILKWLCGDDMENCFLNTLNTISFFHL